MTTRATFAFLLTLALCPYARAAAPAVDYIYPAGGQQGESFPVTVGQGRADSKIDPWPAKIWIDCPGVTFEAEKNSGSFKATIAKDAAEGPHVIRVYNADGTSKPGLFVVGRHREAQENEKEANNDYRQAQAAGELPAVVNGRLEKNEDVDSWAIDAEAGKWIVAEVACRRLGSPLDPVCQLIDPDGVQVAFNHDTFGLDPLIAFQATRGGRYVLQVAGFANPPGSDVRFAGSKGTVYRIFITTGPYARASIPRSIPRGTKSSVNLFGWNIEGGDAGLAVDVDPTKLPAGTDSLVVADPRIGNILRLPLSDLDSRLEAEPNDKAAAAQKVDLPAAIDGQIARPGDTDRFSFSAKKGEKLALSVRAAAFGSPIDPVLVVMDGDGKQLARDNPAAGATDAKLEWTAPADGTFVAAVSDLKHGGGPACVYRLEIAAPAPGFSATVDAQAIPLQPGKSADLKVTVTRQAGHAAPLKITLADLPEGVTAASVDVPAKGGAVTVTLKAAADAKPANVPMRVIVTTADKDEPIERPATFSLDAALLMRNTTTVWLTVGKSAEKAAEPPKKRGAA